MNENRRGKVVTFYSFKGGTGRTMALANVAWILAANGKRVLVADWDLESPGLHRFFKPFIAAERVTGSPGVIDLVRAYEWATTRDHHADDEWYRQHARVDQYAFSIDWTFPDGGTIDFLSSGRQNKDYAHMPSALDWDGFYNNLGGGTFLKTLRADMQRNYDYTLIDSRTGLSDVADICTVELPDVLVDCFTFSEQGIEGAAEVARTVRTRYGARNIRILPVPMRVDQAEKDKADAGRAVAMQRFADLPSEMTPMERRTYWVQVEVPYRPFYAYEEILATFGDQPGSPSSMLAAYEVLTRHITDNTVAAMPPLDEGVRSRAMARFTRRQTMAEEEVTLRYAPEDQAWAEWVERVLSAAGIRVNDPWASGTANAADRGPASPSRDLFIISQVTAATLADDIPADQGRPGPLAVYVTDVKALPMFATDCSAFLAGLEEQAAAERVLRLVGRPDVDPAWVASGHGARFPGTDAVVFNAPARNPRFTGREDDLQALRAQLRRSGATVVLSGAMPVALQGLGGIGKTQVAMEYAHRFRAAYDVVWWITSDPVTFVDGKLADLGQLLDLPAQPTVQESAKSVLAALNRGKPFSRWLLIFDNAEDIDRVAPLLPQGAGGHVLITSRDRLWSDRATPLPVEVFERAESVAHLTRRLPSIRKQDADGVAHLLGDLPIMVAAAGAWLAETGTEVEDFIRLIELAGPSDDLLQADADLRDKTVNKTWDLSLNLIRERSPAAYRLLQLCSVMGSDIALELIYSDEMAAALTPYDPTVAERMVRGKLVQQINRLALLKLDQANGQIQVHRVIQHVVRSRMSPEELDEANHQIHIVLARSRPRSDVDDPESWRRFRMLWPHLEVSDTITCTDEAVRQLLIDRLRYLWLRGDLVIGHDLGERIESVWSGMLKTIEESRRGALRRQLLHLRFNMGNIIRDRGRYQEAYDLNVAVLAAQTELLGPTHAHTLMTSGSLAADLRALGRYPEGLERDVETYALWSENFSDEHPRTLIAMNNLASSYRLMGDFRSARDMDQKVFDRRRVMQGQGEDHPYTLASASNLARDLREAGEYERSITLLRRVVATLSDTLGPTFRGTLNAQANLAVSLRTIGSASEAASLLESAYGQLIGTLGPDGPDTVACRLSMAVNLLALGQVDRSSSELKAVYQTYRQGLGELHPHTLICLNNLAAVARAADDRGLARQLAREATDNLAATLGLDHPFGLAALTNLAICTAEDGDLPAALPIMEEAVRRTGNVLGPDHPDALRSIANLAILGNDLGRSAPGIDEGEALSRLASRLGDAHPAVAALRDRRYLHRTVDPHPF